MLVVLLLQWLWRDWEKGKAAQEALIEKLHQEGREPIAPPTNPGQKAWRWVLNGYAIALVLALVYGLIRYRGTVGVVAGGVLLLALAYGLVHRYLVGKQIGRAHV